MVFLKRSRIIPKQKFFDSKEIAIEKSNEILFKQVVSDSFSFTDRTNLASDGILTSTNSYEKKNLISFSHTSPLIPTNYVSNMIYISSIKFFLFR